MVEVLFGFLILVRKRVHVRMCVRVQVRVSLRQRVRDISAFMCIHREAGIVHGTTRQPQPPPVRGRRRGGVEGSGKEEGAGDGGVVGGAVAQLLGYEDVRAILLCQ